MTPLIGVTIKGFSDKKGLHNMVSSQVEVNCLISLGYFCLTLILFYIFFENNVFFLKKKKRHQEMVSFHKW